MKLVLLLCFAAFAAALDPATIAAIAAKAKAAKIVAGGVTDILDNLNKILKNEGEDIFDKEVAESENADVLLGILQRIKSGELKLAKRDLPSKQELLDRLLGLYDRVHSMVRGGANAGMAALEKALGQLRIIIDNFLERTSVDWLRGLIDQALDKIEAKVNRNEAGYDIIEEEKRDLLPTHDEIVAKFEELYERLRVLLKGSADKLLDVYRNLLDKALEMYKRVRDSEGLGWLKAWIVSVLDKLDAKLQDYAIAKGEEKRDLVPTKEDLLSRLTHIYDRFRAFVNAGADTASDAFAETLEYIRYLINRMDQIKSLKWLTKWITILMDRAEKRLQELEEEQDHSEEKRALLPSKDELLGRLTNLFNRFSALVKAGANTAADAFGEGLEVIRKLIERVEQIKSLDWLKKWIVVLLDRAEDRMGEFETGTYVEEYGLLPAKGEILDKINELYERLRSFVSDKSGKFFEIYKAALDELRKAYEKLEKFKSLDWMKKWIVDALNGLEKKIDEVEERVVARKRRDFEDGLLDKLATIRQKIHQIAALGQQKLAEHLQKAVEKLESIFDDFSQNEKVQWLLQKLEQAVDTMLKFVSEQVEAIIRRRQQ